MGKNQKTYFIVLKGFFLGKFSGRLNTAGFRNQDTTGTYIQYTNGGMILEGKETKKDAVGRTCTNGQVFSNRIVGKSKQRGKKLSKRRLLSRFGV